MMPFGLMLSLEAIELLQICHLIMDPRIKSEGDVRDWDASGDKSSCVANFRDLVRRKIRI